MLRSICFILLISISLSSASLISKQEKCEFVYGDDPDKCRTSCELIQSRGFICENHFVETKDGYILSVQRVVNPVLQKKGKLLKKPYILQHGLFGSSAHFLTNAPGGNAADWTSKPLTDRILKSEGRNLAYLLSNFGYDVWLSNSRGNKYSTNHTRFNTNQAKFWRFTFDQMIAYDAPAVIDYVLSKTLSTKIGWIGHSQGTTIMFGLLSERPEYAAKVEPFIALAPVAHVTNVKSPLKVLAFAEVIKDIIYKHPHKMLKLLPKVQHIMATECNKTLLQNICSVPLFLTSGYNPKQLNKTRLPVYIEQGYADTSNWDLLHFAQNIKAEGFYKFNHGMFWNMIYYQSLAPPAYDLSKIKSKSIVLFNSKNDWLASPADVKTLKKSLEVDTIDHLVEDDSFNHMDFLWAKDVYPLLYQRVIKTMRRFDPETRANYANDA